MNTTIETRFAAGSSATQSNKNGVFARFRAAMISRRQRRSLLALDDRMLADIGISRSQAYGEADRSMFDLPNRHR